MKKLIAIILVAVICLSLTGCNVNFSSVDILMRPPKLSGKNSLLQQTFEETIGNSDSVVMKTPLSGDNRSSYMLYDLDNDSVSEALVLYADPSKDSLAYISVFKFVNEKWSFVSTIKGRSEEIFAIDFADINGNGNLEILISWASSSLQPDSLNSAGLGSINDKNLVIYSYNGNSTTLLKNETYTKLLLEDINNDNSVDLFILNIGLSNQEKVAEGRIVSFDSEYSVENDIKFVLTGMLDVYNIVCDAYALNDESHTRIYIDGAISETGIITEVVDVNHNDFEIMLPFYESNVSAKPLTLRNVRVYCQDFDNDGIVEIPTLENLVGGVRVPANTESKQYLSLTVWSELNVDSLSVDSKCLLNGAYGYMFMFPDEWLGKYTAVYNENDVTLSFYSIDENVTLTERLFSIRAFIDPNWKENNQNYINFDENGVYTYCYQIFDTENEVEYIKLIEDNFISIKQE